MNLQLQHNHKLAGQFMRYVPLNVLGMLALSCYILADTFFVANGVGADGLTALNLVLPIYNFIGGLGLLFGMGGATKFAIHSSSNRPDRANRCFTLSMFLCVSVGTVLMLVGGFFSRDICVLLGADSAILPLADEYLRTIMLFSVAFIANNALVCFVRNDGAPHLSMLAMVTGSLSNIFLDYLFVFPLGMGMFGAAIATCIAPLIGLATLSLHIFSHKSSLRLVRGGIQLRRVGGIVSIGFSAFVTEFSTGMVMLIFNFVILSIAGNTGVAAYGIIANLSLFFIAIFAGISEGVQPLISNFYGAADKRSLGTVFRWAVLLAAGLGILLYLIVLIFAPALTGIFNRDGDAVLAGLATQGMRLYFPLLLLTGINIVTSSLFASISKAWASFLISGLRALVLVAALVFPLSQLFGMTGVWVTIPCTELITFLVSLVLLKKVGKSHLRAGHTEVGALAQAVDLL